MDDRTLENKPIKCVICGDSQVGKTRLLSKYTSSQFLRNDSDQTYLTSVEVEGKSYPIEIKEIFGDFQDKIVSHVDDCREADVILLCFSLVSVAYLKKLEVLLELGLVAASPKSKKILVGTKLDLLSDKGYPKNAKGQGEDFKTRNNLYSYLECSALTGEGVTKVFEEIVKCTRKESKLEKLK